jgi:hypothetical protein
MIPRTEHPLVLLTDFSDPAAWKRICTEIEKPVGWLRFRANVAFLADQQFEGYHKQQVLAALPAKYEHTFIFLVDELAIRQHDHPLLVVDLYEGSGQEFRTLPRMVQGIENNLSIANMDFEEFARAVDARGVFRGFSKR